MHESFSEKLKSSVLSAITLSPQVNTTPIELVPESASLTPLAVLRSLKVSTGEITSSLLTVSPIFVSA